MMFKGEIFLNFWLSALIYNPLEAFILIYFCSIFTEIKIDKNIIKHCYLLGFINLLFQYVTIWINDKVLSLSYDLFVALIISPFILAFYSKFFIFSIFELKICFYACIFNFLSLYISIIIINLFDCWDIWYPVYEVYPNDMSMFNTDFSIKTLQFLILYLFKWVIFIMKNILKTIANKYTEKAFTIMGHYQPKMPKILKEKLEKNK